jgi:hypothetical protein
LTRDVAPATAWPSPLTAPEKNAPNDPSIKSAGVPVVLNLREASCAMPNATVLSPAAPPSLAFKVSDVRPLSSASVAAVVPPAAKKSPVEPVGL